MSLGRLGENLLENVLAGKGAIVKSVSEETKSRSQGRGIVRAGYGNKKVQKTTTKNKGNF